MTSYCETCRHFKGKVPFGRKQCTSPIACLPVSFGNAPTGYEANYNSFYKGFIPLEITKVVFNYPATIVYWKDGTKTVVKCQDGDAFDKEKGLAMAIAKKHFGNKGNYCNVFKKFIKEET